MRLHSNVITDHQLWKALSDEQAAGRIAHSVQQHRTTHRSRTHALAFELHMYSTGKVPGDGRRHTNGAYLTSQTPGATYDEWGWLLSALYRIDPAMVVGTVKTPIYADVLDFHTKTGRWYDLQFSVTIENTGDDPMPWVTAHNGKAARARAGRIGADRRWSDYDRDQMNRHQLAYIVHAPRTADQVRTFAHLTPATVTA